MQSRALFLDRDGVINVNHGYVHRQIDFDFIEGVFDLARAAHSRHYKLVVITNQAGIARGYYSEQQFHELTNWMYEQFVNQSAPIAKVYFSPYHPTEGIGEYRKDDLSRKPHPGMILQAQKELNLDLRKSILIGDKASDIQAGIAAGMGCNILFSEEYPAELPSATYQRITELRGAIPFLMLS
jgi:D-glycero-D-manno-heptose 1,7-bisphosphate phosphatase